MIESSVEVSDLSLFGSMGQGEYEGVRVGLPKAKGSLGRLPGDMGVTSKDPVVVVLYKGESWTFLVTVVVKLLGCVTVSRSPIHEFETHIQHCLIL